MADNDRQELEELEELERLEQISAQTGGAVQAPGLGERIGSRFEKMGTALELNQNPLRTGYRVAGQVFGIPADIVGEGISGIASGINQLTGGYAAKGVGAAGRLVGRLPAGWGGKTIGETLPDEIAMLEDAYNRMSPEQQLDFEATANIGGALLPFLKKSGESVKHLMQIGRGIKAKRTPIKTAEQMRTGAGSKLQAAKESGASFKPDFFDDFIDTAQRELKPKGELSKLAAKGDLIDDFLQDIEPFRGQKLQIDDMAEFDSLLGDKAYSTVDNFGNITKEGKKYLDMQRLMRSKIDDAMKLRNSSVIEGDKNALSLLDQGRKEWSRSLRMQDIERIIRNANMTQNPATSLRTGFKNLINADPKLKGYTKLEKDAIFKAADTGKITDILKTAGSRLMPLGGGVAGGAGGFAAGEALSSAARTGATAAQGGRARTVQKLLSQPAGTQVSPEVAPSLSALLGNIERSGRPVGAYLATKDRPINPLEKYELLGRR